MFLWSWALFARVRINISKKEGHLDQTVHESEVYNIFSWKNGNSYLEVLLLNHCTPGCAEHTEGIHRLFRGIRILVFYLSKWESKKNSFRLKQTNPCLIKMVKYFMYLNKRSTATFLVINNILTDPEYIAEVSNMSFLIIFETGCWV